MITLSSIHCNFFFLFLYVCIFHTAKCCLCNLHLFCFSFNMKLLSVFQWTPSKRVLSQDWFATSVSEPIQAAGSTTSIQDGTGEKSVPEQTTDALRYRLISEEFNLIYKRVGTGGKICPRAENRWIKVSAQIRRVGTGEKCVKKQTTALSNHLF